MISAMIAAAILQSGGCEFSERGEAETARGFLEALIRDDDARAMTFAVPEAEVRYIMDEDPMPVEDMLEEVGVYEDEFAILGELHVPNHVVLKLQIGDQQTLAAFQIFMGCVNKLAFYE